jgi:hypothetical protein
MNPDQILKLASRFEELVNKDVWHDLAKSMKACKKVLKQHLKHVEKGMPRSHVEEVRDFAGNLALLCNMILNGKEYSQEEKVEAIRDEIGKDAIESLRTAVKAIESELGISPAGDYSTVRARLDKLAQDVELEGPNVIIQPMEGLVQQAVNKLKQMDPNYFKGVRSIVIAPQPHYGFVESGPEKDPAVIHLNYNRIRQEISAQGGSDEDVINAVMETIAHEKGHVASFQPQQGFVGGEQPAEQEAQRMMAQLKPTVAAFDPDDPLFGIDYKLEPKHEKIVPGAQYAITEWDDSIDIVDVKQHGDDILIRYPDGVVHKVSPKHFWGDLKARLVASRKQPGVKTGAMNPVKLKGAREAVRRLTSKPPQQLTKQDVEGVYQLMRTTFWKDDQLPDLLKALAVWNTNRKAALGYLFSSSRQGDPIEKKIPGGGGGGVVKDLSRMLDNE